MVLLEAYATNLPKIRSQEILEAMMAVQLGTPGAMKRRERTRILGKLMRSTEADVKEKGTTESVAAMGIRVVEVGGEPR